MVEETMGRDEEVDEAAHRRFYEAESDQRAGRALSGPRVEKREQFIATSDPASGRLLEIGTGPGLDAARFSDAGFDVVGIDLASANAARASRHRSVWATVASATGLPLATGSVAFVWSVSTLMHLTDDEVVAALGETRRVARADARILFGTWGGHDVVDVSRQDPFGLRRFHRRSDSTWVRMLETHLGSVESYEMVGHGDESGWTYQWAEVRPRH